MAFFRFCLVFTVPYFQSAMILNRLCFNVKVFLVFCRCSMIMSVVNWSEKMSVWGYERETDIELERAEAVVGHE